MLWTVACTLLSPTFQPVFLLHIPFHSTKGSQFAQKGVQHDSAWSCDPRGIHLLSPAPPCHAFGTQFFLTHLPIPNQGYLKKKISDESSWSHQTLTTLLCLCVLVYRPQVQNLYFGNIELFVTSCTCIAYDFSSPGHFLCVKHLSCYFH